MGLQRSRDEIDNEVTDTSLPLPPPCAQASKGSPLAAPKTRNLSLKGPKTFCYISSAQLTMNGTYRKNSLIPLILPASGLVRCMAVQSLQYPGPPEAQYLYT